MQRWKPCHSTYTDHFFWLGGCAHLAIRLGSTRVQVAGRQPGLPLDVPRELFVRECSDRSRNRLCSQGRAPTDAEPGLEDVLATTHTARLLLLHNHLV